MQTLLLTSKGMTWTYEELLKILPKDPRQTAIAHITTACNLKGKGEAPWKDDDERIMKKLGFQFTNIDIEGKSEVELEKSLSGFDVIFVQGGTPYYLLKQVNESGFDKVVRRLIKKGIIYMGASAGSYIACPTLEMARWKNPDRQTYGLQEKEPAMNLVPFLISAHYEPKFKNSIEKAMKTTDFPVRVLKNGQALLVQNGVVKFVGKGEEVVLGKGK